VTKPEFGELKKSNYKKAIQMAIDGMNFRWYMESEIMLKLYGRYFLYLELSKASQVIALHYNGNLAGLLLCDIFGEPKYKLSSLQYFYIKLVDFIQRTFIKDGIGPYEEANKEMFSSYSKSSKPDGEICFLAADRDLKISGIGTMLLSELEKRERGKEIYLYTDSGCTYQFYEHRGFERVGEKDIELSVIGNKTKITCLLYRKKFPL